MWLSELKLWLLISLVPGLCYLTQAVAIRSDHYHDDVVQYMKTSAKTSQDVSLGDNQAGINNLTFYYLLHPGINVPAELSQNN